MKITERQFNQTVNKHTFTKLRDRTFMKISGVQKEGQISLPSLGLKHTYKIGKNP